MQERSLIGLEARGADGTEVGRIVEVVTDEEGGEVTYVIVETEEGEQLEVPLTSLSLDPDADFATFRADASDVEPGDHTDDEVGVATETADPNATPTSEVEPQGYSPEDSPDDLAEEDPEEYEHEGQLVTESEYEEDAETEKDFETREDWEDESYTPDSGYPRNDTYVNPDTGEVEEDPFLSNVEGVKHDVAELLDGTDLQVGNVREGVVELTGAASTQEDLDEAAREVMGLDGVLEVDTTDVDVG